jgi:hypothetical protein
MKIFGVDFTCAPRKAKPITVAAGRAHGTGLEIDEIEPLETFADFEALLVRPGPWVGGFDFPFGLSREAVGDLSWPERWSDLLVHCAQLGRVEFKRVLDAYRESRPPGNRYAKRRGDVASGAHPSVKLVRPPVGFMFFEGAARLMASGIHIPGLRAADRSRVALEAYPGFLVRRQLQMRESYKSDSRKKQTAARQAVREKILAELIAARPLGIQLRVGRLQSKLIEDGSGDYLDAVICALQAHWGWLRADSNFGLPADLDPLEGWIVSA